jgi:tetraprenyl-beta-curcumene synthase
MNTPAFPSSLRSRALIALVRANATYWITVAPLAWRELRRWTLRARLIDEPVLRGHALFKLREDDGNVKTTVTLATLAPRRQRPRVVRAIVALQVMYDYLDAVSEERFADGARTGADLFRAFDAAFCADAATDYYRGHPRRDHSGYLDALATSCREALERLPRLTVVSALAASTAAHSGRAQELSHGAGDGAIAQLAAWAAPSAAQSGLHWWEEAAGSAASILAVHALIAAAGDPRMTRTTACQTAHAYRLAATLTTLLDSLVDHERDRCAGEHSYVAYYADAGDAAERIAAVARRTAAAAAELPRAPHHLMTVAGIAAFYLSGSGSRSAFARPAAASVMAEMRPLILPILWIFRTWRLLRKMAVVLR